MHWHGLESMQHCWHIFSHQRSQHIALPQWQPACCICLFHGAQVLHWKVEDSRLLLKARAQHSCMNPTCPYTQMAADVITAIQTIKRARDNCRTDDRGTMASNSVSWRQCLRCFAVAAAAVVPAGFYLKAPGQVAPCPRGEYKPDQGINANCTKCADGVMTPAEGATSADNCTSTCA